MDAAAVDRQVQLRIPALIRRLDVQNAGALGFAGYVHGHFSVYSRDVKRFWKIHEYFAYGL